MGGECTSAATPTTASMGGGIGATTPATVGAVGHAPKALRCPTHASVGGAGVRGYDLRALGISSAMQAQQVASAKVSAVLVV